MRRDVHDRGDATALTLFSTARVWMHGAACACAWIAVALGAASLDVKAQTNPIVRTEMRVLRAQVDDTSSTPMRALTARFPEAVVSDQIPSLLTRPGAGMLVVTDGWSLRVACSVTHTLPIIAVFLPAIEFERGAVGCRTKLITAVYADSSPLDQLRVMTEIYGQRVRVLALAPEDAPTTRQQLDVAAAQLGVSLAIEIVPDQANVTRVLARAQPFDVLLALADSTLYSPTNVRTLLEATYRRGIGMIGFSPSATRAGMLASAYALPEDSLEVLADMLTRYGQTGQLLPARHPKQWRVAINETVARSLSIALPAEFNSDVPRASGASK
jgi:putative tryptophan/tyrosine transport system substrate-binding protein